MQRHGPRASAAASSLRGGRGLGGFLVALLLVSAIQLAACDGPAPAGQAAKSRRRVIVKLKKRDGRASALATSKEGLRYRNNVPALGASVYTVKEGDNVDEVVSRLNKLDDVEYAVPDQLVRANAGFKPNDPQYKRQWHFPKVSAPMAWSKLRGKARVKVCHVDSGVRMGHPDLQAAVAMGWNFVPKNEEPLDVYDPVLPSDPWFKVYNDTYGHGTITGGVIAAVTNNKRGVASTAFGVKLLVCRFLFDDGTGWVSDAINCWSLCDAQGATIYSNSWGDVQPSAPLKEALLYHQAKGHTMVFAAGNSGANLNGGFKAYPPSYRLPCQINVAASDADDNLALFSNWGRTIVDLAAPGVDILSTAYTGQYGSNSGTSFAAPIVTGMAALMQSRAYDKGITLRYQEIKTFILNNVDRPAALKGRLISNGRLNMERTATRFLVWYGNRKARPVPRPAAKPSPSPKPAGRRLLGTSGWRRQQQQALLLKQLSARDA